MLSSHRQEIYMKQYNTEFTRFILVGGINSLNYYVVYLVCIHILSIHYFVGHVLGYVVSLIGSFFMNVYFTYRVKPTWIKFLTFPLSQSVNIIASTIFLFTFIEWFNIDRSLAPVFSVLLMIPITFLITGKILKRA